MLDHIRFELSTREQERQASKEMATNFFLDLILYLNSDPYLLLKRMSPTPQDIGIIYTLHNRIEQNEMGRLTLHKQEMNGKNPFCVFAVNSVKKQESFRYGALIFWNIKKKIPTSTTLWTNFDGDLTMLDIRGLLQKPKDGNEVTNAWGITSSDVEITALNGGDIIDQTLTTPTRTGPIKTRWRYLFLGKVPQSNNPNSPSYSLWIEEHRAKVSDGQKEAKPQLQVTPRGVLADLLSQ